MVKEIVVFNNGVVTEKGMSGSDNRALNWTRIWSKSFEVTLVIPFGAMKRYSSLNVRKILTTKKNTNSTSPIYWLFAYICRAYQGMMSSGLVSGDPLLVYSSSDLIPDSLPAFFLKYRNQKKAKTLLVMGCHLIAPHPFSGYRSGGGKLLAQNLYYFLTQRAVLAMARRIVDLTLVSNKIDKQKLIDLGFSEDKVLVAYGGVDTTEIEPILEQEKCFEAVFIGRNHPQKGIDDLILSWKEVCLKKPDARLAVVGDDEIFVDLKRKFSDIGLLANVEFKGYLKGEAKYKVLKASKILLFPSYYESFGMVALEALACGVPVIAYDLAVYSEVFEDKLITVPRGNYHALAEEVLNNLNRYQDTDFARELQRFAEKFSFQKTASVICEKLL